MVDLRTDECGVDALVLNELAGELVDHASIGERWRAFDVHLLADLLKELVGRVGVKLLIWWELLPSLLLELRAV